MSWFRVSDGLAFHAKTVAAGNEAVGAWVRAGSWSSAGDNLTEGFVPAGVATTIAPRRVWKKLVDVRLVEERDGGYQLHDFRSANPAASAVRAERAAWAERQQRARDKARESREESRRDAPRDSRVESRRPTPTPTPSSSGQGDVDRLRALDPAVLRAGVVKLAEEGLGVAQSVAKLLDAGKQPSRAQWGGLAKCWPEVPLPPGGTTYTSTVRPLPRSPLDAQIEAQGREGRS